MANRAQSWYSRVGSKASHSCSVSSPSSAVSSRSFLNINANYLVIPFFSCFLALSTLILTIQMAAESINPRETFGLKRGSLSTWQFLPLHGTSLQLGKKGGDVLGECLQQVDDGGELRTEGLLSVENVVGEEGHDGCLEVCSDCKLFDGIPQ